KEPVAPPARPALVLLAFRGREHLEPLQEGVPVDQFEPVRDVLHDLGVLLDLRRELPSRRDTPLARWMICIQRPEQISHLCGFDDMARLVLFTDSITRTDQNPRFTAITSRPSSPLRGVNVTSSNRPVAS